MELLIKDISERNTLKLEDDKQKKNIINKFFGTSTLEELQKHIEKSIKYARNWVFFLTDMNNHKKAVHDKQIRTCTSCEVLSIIIQEKVH